MSEVNTSALSTTVTADSFERDLVGMKKGIETMRGRTQALLVFACLHYEKHGNAGYLDKIQNTANTVRGLNARGIQAYIQAVCNVVWSRNKADVSVFKKRAPEKGQNTPDLPTCNHDVLAIAFYDWIVENLSTNNAKHDWKLEKYVLSVLGTCGKHGVGAEEFMKAFRKVANA